MNDKEKREYQTWLVKVNIDNILQNYNVVKYYGETLLACDDYDFKVIIKNEMVFHDTIEWDFVNWTEIRASIAELI